MGAHRTAYRRNTIVDVPELHADRFERRMYDGGVEMSPPQPPTEDYELEWDDVDMLREVACCTHHSEACKDLADYLATLLPPRGESEGDSNASNDEARKSQTRATTEKPNPESFRGHTGGE
jgi:hypothetical protein